MSQAASSEHKDFRSYDCKYTFQEPKFTGIQDKSNEDRVEYMGFKIDFESQTECATDENYSWEIQVTCADEFAFKKNERVNSCKTISYYEGKEGCAIFDFGENTAIKFVKKFLGIFEILAGIILCFFGSKFIFYVLRFLVFVLVNLVAWGLCYNLHIIRSDSKPGLLIALGVVTLAGGIAVAHYFGNFAEKYGMAILSGCAGAFIMFMITANLDLKALYKEILIGATAVGAIYIGKMYNKFIKSAGTAIIGSFFLMHGLGQYIGGFPDFIGASQQLADEGIDTDNIDPSDFKSQAFIGYILGMIAAAVLGTVVQLKYIAPEDEDEDDMMKKEDS